MAEGPGPMRVPPRLGELNREYWTGGLSGELRIMRCQDCGWWLHPPSPVCRKCLSRHLAAEAVSGRGTVEAYTINHQQWSPTATPDPYVIAIVELPEQEGLRQTTNIVNCAVGDVHIGMPVRVVFEPLADVAIPLFEPDLAADLDG
jgi:uncharacterized OB-fold protein